MLTKKYPGSVVLALAVFACSGWAFALLKGGSNQNTGSGADGKASARSSRTSSRDNSRSDAAATAINDPVTSKLMRDLAEIKAAAVPGQVNQALINACRNVLNDSNPRRRDRNYGLLLELMRPEDASTLHELFLELHAQGRTFAEYGNFATRWGEVDPEGALDYLTNERFFWLPPRDFSSVVRGWGVTDPLAAMKWIDDHPDVSGTMGGHVAVLEGWVREDPTAALKWLSSQGAAMDPSEYINASRVAFLEQVQGPNAGLDAAISWITSLQDDGLDAYAARIAWDSSQWCMGELNYESAAKVWSQVGDKPWIGFDQFRNFSESIGRSRTADQGSAGFLKALGATWSEQKITDRFAEWTEQDPAATSEWLANAPDTKVTQAAISGMIRSLQETDPDAAAQWRERLKN